MPRAIARTEFSAAVKQVATERGLDPEVVLETIKSAIIAAFRKDAKERGIMVEQEWEYEAELDPVTGAVKVFGWDPEVEDAPKQDMTPPGFGRIAAQTAKQVIVQKIREAEKAVVIGEYSEKVGTLVHGMILRFDGPMIVVDLGKTEAVMPSQEQSSIDNYELNQRLTFYVTGIRESMRGQEVVVSRAAKELVELLFKREVPEVNSGSVEIKAMAREAGARTKMAVTSTQQGVDPVGSCVGQKGVRVQAVINELNGEKIDIIEYSDDPIRFINAAMSPAEVTSVKVDQDKLAATVAIPDDQLSLAIGKEGQNVRLAAKLTGYKLDVIGDSGAKPESIGETGNIVSDLEALELSTRTLKALQEADITTVAALQAQQETIGGVKGIGPKAVEEIAAALAKLESLPAITSTEDQPSNSSEVIEESPATEPQSKDDNQTEAEAAIDGDDQSKPATEAA